MTIEIEDNRQEWLINLGEQYAAAVQAETTAETAYRKAVAQRMKIANDIAQIGGYIIDARNKKPSKKQREVK